MPAHKKVSTRQMELLVQYMEEHRDLAVGRLSNNGPHQKLQTKSQWEEVAAILNGIGDGTVKQGPKWRESNTPFATDASSQSPLPMPTLVQNANAEIEMMPSAAPETVTVAIPHPDVIATPATVAVAAVTAAATAAVITSEPPLPLPNRLPRAADRHIVPPIPQWATDMESRRRAAEERTAEALEAIAGYTLSNVVVQQQQ